MDNEYNYLKTVSNLKPGSEKMGVCEMVVMIQLKPHKNNMTSRRAKATRSGDVANES